MGPRIGITFGTEKIDWWIYQTVKKIENMFIRFNTIYKRDGRTDRQTPSRQSTSRFISSA